MLIFSQDDQTKMAMNGLKLTMTYRNYSNAIKTLTAINITFSDGSYTLGGKHSRVFIGTKKTMPYFNNLSPCKFITFLNNNNTSILLHYST